MDPAVQSMSLICQCSTHCTRCNWRQPEGDVRDQSDQYECDQNGNQYQHYEESEKGHIKKV
eukprot:6410288-Amphidinium_carterae.1